MEFNDGMKDGFGIIRDAFMKAVGGGSTPGEIAGKAQRVIATGAKSAVEKAKTEFSPQFIEDSVRGVYGFVGGRDLAEGVSMIAQSVNLDELQTGLENVVAQLKTEEVSMTIARQLKGETDKDMLDATKSLLSDKISALDEPQATIARALFEQLVEPSMERMKNEPGRNMLADLRESLENQMHSAPVWQQALMSGMVNELARLEAAPVEEVAASIRDHASAIPADQIAMQLYLVAQSVSPERVMSVTHKAVGQLPSPATISGVFTGVADAALKQLGRAADPEKADAPASADEFLRDVTNVVKNAAANDDTKKTDFGFGKDKGQGGGRKFKL